MKIPDWLMIAFLVVSFLGFLDATYLTAQHYLGAIPPCVITTGCETVLTSEYNAIFGIPVALLGSIYYLSLFLLAVFALDIKREVIHFAAYLSPIGFLASLYFVYLQLFVIKEICSYCIVSAATSTILFILGMFIIIKSKSRMVRRLRSLAGTNGKPETKVYDDLNLMPNTEGKTDPAVWHKSMR